MKLIKLLLLGVLFVLPQAFAQTPLERAIIEGMREITLDYETVIQVDRTNFELRVQTMFNNLFESSNHRAEFLKVTGLTDKIAQIKTTAATYWGKTRRAKYISNQIDNLFHSEETFPKLAAAYNKYKGFALKGAVRFLTENDSEYLLDGYLNKPGSYKAVLTTMDNWATSFGQQVRQGNMSIWSPARRFAGPTSENAARRIIAFLCY